MKRLLYEIQWLLLALLGLAGCHTSSENDPSQFVALQSDFEGFMYWKSWKVSDEPLDDTHISSSRYVYINEVPASGSTDFPIGTLIVKTDTEGDNPHHWTVFGRAKRGGSYNADGAMGWEWFGIIISEEGTPLIDWRGPVPPVYSNYACDLGEDDDTALLELGDCNSCHMTADNNDYVLSSALKLDEF